MGPDVPDRIRDFFNINRVSTFIFDRAFHQGQWEHDQFLGGSNIECRTSHIADDLKKSFWKNIQFGRVVFGVVWTGWSSIFSKVSIPQSIISSIQSFLQIILALNASVAWNYNQFRPPTSSNDLCLPFCLILIPWGQSCRHFIGYKQCCSSETFSSGSHFSFWFWSGSKFTRFSMASLWSH